MSLERVGIYGMGNVGSALLMELAHEEPISPRIEVASRSYSHVMAAILDVASAFPEQATVFNLVRKLEGEYDLVVITAGEPPSPEVSQADHLERNVAIAHHAIEAAVCKLFVVVASPVDLLTETLAKDDNGSNRFYEGDVIGFGGELDRARAQFALRRKGIHADPVYVIGEHGSRAIPVYADEEDYEDIKDQTVNILDIIKSATGKARNLATGVQLARLLRALTLEEYTTMCISFSDKTWEDGVAITWPRQINKDVIRDPLDIWALIGPKAEADFKQLLAERKSKSINQ